MANQHDTTRDDLRWVMSEADCEDIQLGLLSCKGTLRGMTHYDMGEDLNLKVAQAYAALAEALEEARKEAR
jgi:hypothetical protein